MSLYLGSQKCKINIDGIARLLNIPSVDVFVNGILLMSSDNYILKDSKGVYLTVKEDE